MGNIPEWFWMQLYGFAWGVFFGSIWAKPKNKATPTQKPSKEVK